MKIVKLRETYRKTQKIQNPADVVPCLKDFLSESQENMIIISLDSNNEIIEIRVVSVGTINRALIHVREIFRHAIIDNASAIIMAHNHPSGNLTPSSCDKDATITVLQASEIIGIPLLDHIIISNNGYLSLRETTTIFN